jgi:hypothetical protein
MVICPGEDLILQAASRLDRPALKKIGDRIADLQHIDPENLGKMYERSTGTARKQRGVYYTPAYIVDDINQQTLGRLLKGKTPTEALSLTILDPACGSGAFLIRAYQYLLDWHAENSDCQLTFSQRKQILLQNIFGVDLDPSAVEVSRIALLIKCIQGQVYPLQLPDLGNNIKCGNSLIDGRITADRGWSKMSRNQRQKINPFDYQTEFPTIFMQGGFGAVIGNPPYLNSVETTTRMSNLLNQWTRQHYHSARGAVDASILFQELGIRLNKPGGYSSMIVPNKFLSAPFGKAFRQFAASHCRLVAMADYSQARVFEDAAVYPITYALQRADENEELSEIEIQIGPSTARSVRANLSKINTWSELFSANPELIVKICECSVPVSELFEIAASASASEAYNFFDAITEGNPTTSKLPLVTSGSIDRYHHRWGEANTRYLKHDFAQPVLDINSKRVSANRRRQYLSPKIIIAGMSRQLEAIYDDGQLAGSVPTVQILARNPPRRESLKYLLAIINSRLSSWFFQQQFSSLSLAGGYLRIGVPQISALRYRCIDFSNELEVQQHDDLVDAVDAMMRLYDNLATEIDEIRQHQIQVQIGELDREIDQTVYKLYGMNEQDIAALAAEAASPVIF